MNPFRDAIVASPWNAAPADIADIHSSAFEQCLQGLQQVRSTGRSAALLIHGEAGSGKTHLLGRLRSWFTPQAPTATDREESLFVWVRLQTSPRMIWRTLRRTLVEDWFRPVEQGRAQIDRILFHRLAELRPAEWDLEPWYEYMLDEDPQGLQALVEQITQQLHLDHNLATAFHHLAFGRHRRELRAWLAGTSLPEPVLERLELAREDGTEEELEEHAKLLVLKLCELTGRQLPIVLSFDQVEALQTRPDDEEALFLFGQMVSTLHDGTRNLFIVSCVQSAFAAELKQHVRGADYDRLTSLGATALQPLDHEQARRLIAARLSAAQTAVPEDADDPGCWPLSPAEFDSLFTAGAVSPRTLLTRCAARVEQPEEVTPFHDPQSPAPVAGLDQALQEILDRDRELKLAACTPDRLEEIVQHGLPLVVRLFAPQTRTECDQSLPDLSLKFITPRGALGLSVCAQSNMNSLAARLRRLNSQWGLQKLQRLVLLRDERVPISEGAKKARQYLAELESRQVVSIFPTVPALAALDAVRNLISNARSGDLAVNGATVSPQVAEEWLQSHLPMELQLLAEEIFAGMPAPAE